MQLRDHTFLGMTQSLCPECLRLAPAKIIASNFAGSLVLALLETSCVLPGGSKNISPVR